MVPSLGPRTRVHNLNGMLIGSAISAQLTAEYPYYWQHCAQRNTPIFNLLRGRFRGFSARRGDTLHRWGEIWHAKFHPHRCNDKGIGPPKLKFLLKFDQNVEYKRPTGAYPLSDLHKICSIWTPFHDALAVKISLDLLKVLWSYGDFKLTS